MMLRVLFIVFEIAVLSVTAFAQQFRTLDGSMNNLSDPQLGKAGSLLNHYVKLHFGGNGYSDPCCEDRPNPRLISNALFQQDDIIPDPNGLSDLVWNFGQFIDHDIILNRGGEGELLLIDVPKGDPFFDPEGNGNATMHIVRSKYLPSTGTSEDNPRLFVNDVTPWLDGSNIYGVSEDRLDWLRSGEKGKLKVSKGDLLPFNTISGEYDDEIDTKAPYMEVFGFPTPPVRYFVAGDIRANEQPGLVCMHTLFVREHNRLCDEIYMNNPGLTDEEIFNKARKKVIAILQNITYKEWLPIIGLELDTYTGYHKDVDPSIMNAFSAAAFRFGHSMVNEQFIRLNEDGFSITFGDLNLKEAFFNPFVVRDEGGIDPFFRGMAIQVQQKVDNKIVGSLRNFLFGSPGIAGLDLVTVNILRGRDRGLPDYNTIRQSFGFSPAMNFDELNTDDESKQILKSVYKDIDTIDPLVGMLSENRFNNSIFGELIYKIIKMQFEAIRDADRYFYLNEDFSEKEINEIENTRLSDVILRNTDIFRLQDEVFKAKNPFVLLDIEPFGQFKNFSFKTYPNPMMDRLNLEVNSISDDILKVQLVDKTGSVVFNKQLSVSKGQNTFDFQIGNWLHKGLYIITIESNSGSGQLKLVKN